MMYKFNEIFSNPFFSIEEGYKDERVADDPYYRIVTGDSVICCVIDADCNFIMVEQFRPNLNAVTLELPAGGIKKGENPLDAARREFLEETGMTADFVYIGNYHLMMNRIKNSEFIFLGLNPIAKEGTISEQGIKVRKISRNEFKKLILDGSYKQLAGVGVVQLASIFLKLDLLSTDFNNIHESFMQKIEN